MTPPILAVIGQGTWGKKIISTLDFLGIPYVIGSRKDWKTIITPEYCEGVIVVTPASTHQEISEQVLKNGLPLFVEKPLSLDSNSILPLYPYQDQTILCNHIHLFSSHFQEIHRRTRNKDILEINSVGCNFGPKRSDCSSLWDYGCHDISMSLYLTGETPTVEKIEKIITTAGEIYNITLKYNFFRHNMVIGNGATKKTRIFQLQTADGFEFVYNTQADAELTINHKPIWEIDPEPPLNTAIKTFVNAIQTGQTDDRFGLHFPAKVVKILEECQKKLID